VAPLALLPHRRHTPDGMVKVDVAHLEPNAVVVAKVICVVQ
jgi:hypothetical protein